MRYALSAWKHDGVLARIEQPGGSSRLPET